MSIELEPNTWYITAGGYAVFIKKTANGAFAATIETSPGIYSNGGTVKEAYTGSHGWVYYPDGRMEFLTPEWNEKLQIVEKAPFSSLPELPEGYRFKDGYARLSPTKDGEFFLSSDGYSVILADGNEFAYHHNFGTKRFILEKEPAQYTELKIGDVLQEGDQFRCKNETDWENCVIRENEENNTIKSTDLEYYSYRRPVQNIVLSRPDTKTAEKLRDALDLKNKPYEIKFGQVLNFTLDTDAMTLTPIGGMPTKKENVMTELMNKTKPVVSTIAGFAWRLAKHQTNYWLFEPTKDVVSRVMRSVRYITLFSAIGAGTYAYNYPQEAKDLAMKCLPKIQVSFEKPEILN